MTGLCITASARGDLISLPVDVFNVFTMSSIRPRKTEAFNNLGEVGEINLTSGAKRFNTDIIFSPTHIRSYKPVTIIPTAWNDSLFV